MKQKICIIGRFIILSIFFIFTGVSQTDAVVITGTLDPFSYTADSFHKGDITSYTFTYTTQTQLNPPYEMAIYAIFPDGFIVGTPASATITVDGVSKTPSEMSMGGGRSLFIRLGEILPAGSDVVVQINNVTNHSTPGSYNFMWVYTANGGGNGIDVPVTLDPIVITGDTYTAHYATGDNGDVIGDVDQSIAEGGCGSEVVATPDEGYRFVNWSDGYSDPYRTDCSLTSNVDVTANFGPLVSDVWVDDDYCQSCDNDGHVWQVDAFDDIEDAAEVVNNEGVVTINDGEYEEEIDIEDKTVTIQGAEGSQPTIRSYCDDILTIEESNDVIIRNLRLLQLDEDGEYCYSSPVVRVGWDSSRTVLDNVEIAGGYIGVALRYDETDATIKNSHLHDNSWSNIVWLGAGNHIITDNTIESSNRGISIGDGPDQSEEKNISGSVISGNTIRNNSDEGIYYTSGDQENPVTIGPDNVITGNGDGIYIDGHAHNLFINGNRIYENINIISALHVDGAETGLNATENWWGDDSGPYVDTYNPRATGDTISIVNSNSVLFRPYCLNEDCDELSEFGIDSENLDILFDNGGTMSVPEGEDYDNVTQIEVNEDTVITVEVDGGETMITLPADTIITRSDESDFDINDLSATEVALSELSGFAIDETVEGAIQWGIPNLGLSFSQPIRIDLFVGTDLNGRTLVIKRSLSMSDNWTDDGIVDPGTCEVTNGICSFETTKASYYTALDGGSDDGDGTGDDTGDDSDEEDAQKAHIDSWKAYQYKNTNLSTCAMRLKITIKGKHFDKDAEVMIGSRKASSVNRKSSREITAKFCMDKLLKSKDDHKKRIYVINPDAKRGKADKEIDLDAVPFEM